MKECTLYGWHSRGHPRGQLGTLLVPPSGLKMSRFFGGFWPWVISHLALSLVTE